jgi:hypothetical protein
MTVTIERPLPVHFDRKNPKTGTAYPHHPPSKRREHWSWRYLYKDEHGKIQRRSLGRIKREDVKRTLVETLQISLPYVQYDLSDIDTIGKLLRVWYGGIEHDRIDLRACTKKHYLSDCKLITLVLDNLNVQQFNFQSVEHLKRVLNQKEYKPNTVYKAIQTLKLALRWGESYGVEYSIPIDKIKNKRPKQEIKPTPIGRGRETFIRENARRTA